MIRFAVIALVSTLTLGWCDLAEAKRKGKGKRPRSDSTEAKKSSERVESEGEGDDRDVRKVYRIKTELVVEGRIQKPNAFYILQRSTINYDWVDLKRRFIPEIFESVRQRPF